MDTFDLRSLRVEPHHPLVLRSDVEARTIAIKLPAGELLQEHQVHERTWVFVAEGEIEIVQDGFEPVMGGAGFAAHFEPNERHEVRARRDSLLLLVLAPWPGAGHPSEVARRAGAA